jgi:CHAT domain-containing protein/tetratricopeptide (TPR) repeat protein
MTRVFERPVLSLAALLLSTLAYTGAAQAAQPGVVVEAVSARSAGEKAGIRGGDVLLAWERPASPPANPERAEGTIESAFDWMWVEMEQGPRGPVRVRGERGGKETAFEIPTGNWAISVRPRFDEDALDAYTEGTAAVRSKDFERGIALWMAVAASAESTHHMSIACWMNLRAGDTWAEARRWNEAQTTYQRALDIAARSTCAGAEAFIRDASARTFQRANRFQDAERAYQSARVARETTWGESLSLARSLNDLGRLAWIRGDLPSAEAYFTRAHTIQDTLAPDSLDVARSLNNLGNVARDRGELATADAQHQRALSIRETVAPDSLDVAGSLNNLGNVAWDRGDLAVAEIYYKRGLAIQEYVAPDGVEPAGSLNNLGLVAHDRGDLAMAEAYHRRAMAIKEKAAPDNKLDLAASLNNLGNVASSRGDLALAEVYFRRTLEIHETLTPDSLNVARTLHNLGNVLRRRRDLLTADRYHKRALDIRDKLAPGSLQVASSLSNLGNVARDRNDLETAEAYYVRALAIRETLGSGSVDHATSLNRLGNVAFQRGDLAAAEAYHKRALTIQHALVPGSSYEALSLYELGLVYRKAGQPRLAADHFRHAVAALETQTGKLGGTPEAQAGFGAQFADYYRSYIDVLIELNEPTEAFTILERSRARTLLAMLAERDLVFTTDVPEALERDRKRLAREYDQTQARLARLNPLNEQSQIEALLNRLRELRDDQSSVIERIRHTSPRLASLQYPQPLNFKAAQAALDPGTVLLSYSVGQEGSYLFAVRAQADIEVYSLGIGDTQLREEVERFRTLVQRTRLGANDLTSLLQRGKYLFQLLIQPAAKMAGGAQRILVIPDGPLHLLPFAALVRGVDAQAARARRDWQYLIEWKPVHGVVSATVYSELRKQRRAGDGTQAGHTLIAFGDPTYPTLTLEQADTMVNPEVRDVVRRGDGLERLPASRREVEGIARLYAGRVAAYLGAQATEERARTIGKGVRYVHFASHGLLDERFPLNSALALTIPERPAEGQANGLLQAWEIFEQMRIDADLVTLSACETGLGKELGGEGLVGLTRAFQYAGARTVLASLWSVGDESTAPLMMRLYTHLKAGKTKDAALRAAQLELIRTRRSQETPPGAAAISHPFHWAAFQLIGDWK